MIWITFQLFLDGFLNTEQHQMKNTERMNQPTKTIRKQNSNRKKIWFTELDIDAME